MESIYEIFTDKVKKKYPEMEDNDINILFACFTNMLIYGVSYNSDIQDLVNEIMAT